MLPTNKHTLILNQCFRNDEVKHALISKASGNNSACTLTASELYIIIYNMVEYLIPIGQKEITVTAHNSCSRIIGK